MIKQVRVVNSGFSEYVENSVNRLKVPKNIYVEGYLVALLSKFVKKGNEFLSDQPLIIRLQHSISLEDYIDLGDETLFVTGFFPESLLKKKNKKYVVSIGKGSYMHAATRLNNKGEGHIYAVLSEKFENYSIVLNDVKYNMLEVVDDQEFFNLYKTWKEYNNPKILEKLKEAASKP